jgi:hypothetical protein
MCSDSIQLLECVGGMGQGGGASMRICPMTERGFFSFGQIVAPKCDHTVLSTIFCDHK